MKHYPNRGPRPGTWWKHRKPVTVFNAGTDAVVIDQAWLNDQRDMRGLPPINVPPIYTRPEPVKNKLNDKSFHPGMLRFRSDAGKRRGK